MEDRIWNIVFGLAIILLIATFLIAAGVSIVQWQFTGWQTPGMVLFGLIVLIVIRIFVKGMRGGRS